MVCKEELCVWFKNLSPHKRIDYLCGMLHICLPLELRFVGSYVEDLAKKDSVHLREHEGKANNREELSKFSEIDAKSFRTRMAIYLALLRSSNRTCSSLIYQLLENNIKQTLTVMDNMDEMTVHNILLVLSMAMNHPAFSYHEKIRMYGYYNTAYETATLLFNKVTKLLECSEYSSLAFPVQDVPKSPEMHMICHCESIGHTSCKIHYQKIV